MGSTTWPYAAGDALSLARVASGNVALDFQELAAVAGCHCLYHLNEADYSSGLVDSSGNGRDMATVYGSPTQVPAGWLNAEASLAGAEGFRTTAGGGTLGSGVNLCVEAWINPSAVNVNHGTILGFLNVFYFHLHNDTLATYWYNRSGDYTYSTAGIITTGNRFHVAVQWTSAGPQFYINGVARGSASIGGTGVTVGGTNTMRLGYENAGGNLRFYKGLIDEVRAVSGIVYSAPFSPLRYPASGTWTVAAARAQAAVLPGVLSVTPSVPIPASTSLRAKLLSAAGGDTGFQLMPGTVVVSGAGTAGVNGTYLDTGTPINAKPEYANGGYKLTWSGTVWRLHHDLVAYYEGVGADLPCSSWTKLTDGDNPPPTVAGPTYSYDFTGQIAGDWYPAVQLFAGAALNANTPAVASAALAWTLPATGQPAIRRFWATPGSAVYHRVPYLRSG